jgi:hypothetical protein
MEIHTDAHIFAWGVIGRISQFDDGAILCDDLSIIDLHFDDTNTTGVYFWEED